jgi:hypothetical protein
MWTFERFFGEVRFAKKKAAVKFDLLPHEKSVG